ncbi:MAG: glycosyl hydrolase family 8 [bacterium]|nr:glycosyl hydrolase family 8 [bacterium]
MLWAFPAIALVGALGIGVGGTSLAAPSSSPASTTEATASSTAPAPPSLALPATSSPSGAAEKGTTGTTRPAAKSEGTANAAAPAGVPAEEPNYYENEAAPDYNKALALWGTGGASAIAGLYFFGLRNNRARERGTRATRGAVALPRTVHKLAGALLIAAAAGIFIGVLYYQNENRGLPLVFSSRAMLKSLWSEYKQKYVDPATARTIDREQGDITTSEGQSYTLLRAVWMDDKQTFDRSFEWTKGHLERPDHLFSWRYGTRPDGTMGVLPGGGENSASDADTDIALALLFAWSRWGDERYLEEAKPVIDAIWKQEVVMVNGKPYLAANNLEKKAGTPHVLVNPSYFAPYAYRIFAGVDDRHPWEALVDTSYEVIAQSAALPTENGESAGLPPDWVHLDRKTGKLSHAAGLSTHYGFDAMRIPFRLALDSLWFGEPRATETLERFRFLGEEWERRAALAAVYARDGAPVSPREAPAFYGGAIGYFMVADKDEFKEILKKKLVSLYNPDTDAWKLGMSYYDDNWAWFGLALAHEAIPDLGGQIARAAK